MAVYHGRSGGHPPHVFSCPHQVSRDPAWGSVTHTRAKIRPQRQTVSFLLLRPWFQQLSVELQFVQSWQWTTRCGSMGRNVTAGCRKWEPKLGFLSFSWSPETWCGFCRTSKHCKLRRCGRNQWFQTNLCINAWGPRASLGGRLHPCTGGTTGPSTSVGCGGLAHAGVLHSSDSSRNAVWILASEGWLWACRYQAAMVLFFPKLFR